MPHLRFRATPIEIVRALSLSLPTELSGIMKTEETNFTFEHEGSQFFVNGEPSNSFPIVEVHWFARNQEVQDQSANLITAKLKAYFPKDDIVVIFKEISKLNYYENGQHF